MRWRKMDYEFSFHHSHARTHNKRIELSSRKQKILCVYLVDSRIVWCWHGMSVVSVWCCWLMVFSSTLNQTMASHSCFGNRKHSIWAHTICDIKIRLLFLSAFRYDGKWHSIPQVVHAQLHFRVPRLTRDSRPKPEPSQWSEFGVIADVKPCATVRRRAHTWINWTDLVCSSSSFILSLATDRLSSETSLVSTIFDGHMSPMPCTHRLPSNRDKNLR